MPTPDASAYTRQRRLGSIGVPGENANNFGVYSYQFVPSSIRLPVFLPSITNRPTKPVPYQGINKTQRPAKTINVPQSLSLYITTIAGTTGGYSGDGFAATLAQLSEPYGVAVDSVGNVYIADMNNNCIRKLNTAGIITTIAGNGVYGFSGDGGAATSAQLSYPYGVAVDSVGNVYIADTLNNRIRKVNATTQIITTIAGNDIVGGFSGDGGAATSAKLNAPFGLCVDSVGNVYIADTSNNRIRKVNASTQIITTIAGNDIVEGFSGDGGAATSAKLAGPVGVFVDSSFNVYIADTNNQRIRKVNASDQKISTIAGTGATGSGGDGFAATLAQLYYPGGVCVDSAGNVYIADTFNRRVRKITASTGIITTIAGTGVGGYTGDGGLATAAQMNYVQRICIDSGGNIYISDNTDHRIRKLYYA